MMSLSVSTNLYRFVCVGGGGGGGGGEGVPLIPSINPVEKHI